MSVKIKKVSAKFIEDDHLLIKIKTSEKDKNVEVTAKVSQASSKIRFTINNPEIKERMTYEGIVEGKKLFLYPIIGRGVLTTQPINIK